MNATKMIWAILPCLLLGCDANANPLMDKNAEELEALLGNAQARSCFYVVDGSQASNDFHKAQCEAYEKTTGYSKDDIADKALREHWQDLKVEAKCELDINKVKELGPEKLARGAKSGVGQQCQPFLEKYGK